MRVVVGLLVVAYSLGVTVPGAGGSEPLQDANVKLLSLKVNGKGEALFTYRRSDGRLRNVLVWGAINARAPSADVPQVRFKWDYAGGWGKYRNGKYCHSFVPQRPFAGYPSQEMRPPANGERYRVTVGGPGVLPVMQVEVHGLSENDRFGSGSGLNQGMGGEDDWDEGEESIEIDVEDGFDDPEELEDDQESGGDEDDA